MYILCQEIDSAIPIRLNFIIVSRITPSGAHVSSYMGWGMHSGLLQNVRQDMVKKYRSFWRMISGRRSSGFMNWHAER